MAKHESILDVVRKLQLHHPSWILVDHWEADLCAIGIAEAHEPRRLAYVSTWKQPAGRYFLELESPEGEDYKVDGTFEAVDFEELEGRIFGHLHIEEVT
ncbi:MAG: hypothetical protein R3E66_22605 [bacterium]